VRNYYLLLVLCGTLAVLTARNRQAPKVLSPDPTRITREPPVTESPAKIIALVKFQDVIYRCYKVDKNLCGYDLKCEGLEMTCATDLIIEYKETR